MDPVRLAVAWYDKDGCCVGGGEHVFAPAPRATHYQVTQSVVSCQVPDTCPQCGEADLVPVGAKHRCPVCHYLQPCCTGPSG